MKKHVIIINGRGGVGKDTLCGFVAEEYATANISSITPIKELARRFGWNGEKDARSRRFLADLKRAFVIYNDMPLQYMKGEYEKFLQSENQILFVHIREPEEIEKFRRMVNVPCATLLIRRGGPQSWGNASDDNVESYAYDYIYQNDKPLAGAKEDFLAFLRERILCQGE